MKKIDNFIGSKSAKWQNEEQVKFFGKKTCHCGQIATRTAIDPASLEQINTCERCGKQCDDEINEELENG